MMFVSFQYIDQTLDSEGFHNTMLDDTIEPSSPLDIINLTKKIEDTFPVRDITILWWKML